MSLRVYYCHIVYIYCVDRERMIGEEKKNAVMHKTNESFVINTHYVYIPIRFKALAFYFNHGSKTNRDYRMKSLDL